MDHFEKNIKRNPITQDDRDRLLQKDYENLKDGGYTARLAIWAYAEVDEPIPNELKPFLRELLLGNFRGKKQKNTANKWLDLIKEVAFHINKTGDTNEDACEYVASLYDEINADTLYGEYKRGKYRKIKDQILNS